MKNKFLLIVYLSLLSFFLFKVTLSDEFDFKGSEIEITDNGNILRAVNGAEISSNNGITIYSNKFNYDKIKNILNVSEDVKIVDKLNKVVVEGKEFTYDKNKEIIYNSSFSKISFDEKFFGITEEFLFEIKKKQLISNKRTELSDLLGNKIFADKFKIDLINKTLRTKGTQLIDLQGNKYNINDAIVNLDTNEIIGKDLNINFQNNLFGNKENDPRLKGKSIFIKDELSIINKGIFTTCKKRDPCPPWTMSAETVTHDKKKKIIDYKNAWLKIYDKPVFYFPRFYHPDPTVKRQSGFLVPKFTDSTSLGSSLEIPYYKVVSNNKDFTFKPRFYGNDNFVLNTEYRQANKNSNHILDFSINQDKGLDLDSGNNSKTHFFSNSLFTFKNNIFDSNKIEINFEQASNDTYLKAYKFNSDIIENVSTLNSYLNYEGINDNTFFYTGAEVFEDLTKTKSSDKYEYIIPNFELSKVLSPKNYDGDLIWTTSGNHKQYDTNVIETTLINDLNYNSYQNFLKNGIVSDYNILIKNVNTNSKNSQNYKDHEDSNLLALGQYSLSFPLKKTGDLYNKFFTPKISVRYSPNQTKNINEADRRIDINNIFSLNRIQSDDAIEGGQSITVSTRYDLKNKENVDIFGINLATVYRDEENEDLPIKSTLGQKSSNIFGNLTYKPNENLKFDYNFSLDNSLDRSNYDLFKAEISVNNFINTFEYMEENEDIGNEGYWINTATLKFDKKNSLSFSKRRNFKTGINEFYNLIYQYENDCLTAAIEYNKDYYDDNDVKPTEEIFFSLTIVPFTKTSSPNLK